MLPTSGQISTVGGNLLGDRRGVSRPVSLSGIRGRLLAGCLGDRASVRGDRRERPCASRHQDDLVPGGIEEAWSALAASGLGVACCRACWAAAYGASKSVPHAFPRGVDRRLGYRRATGRTGRSRPPRTRSLGIGRSPLLWAAWTAQGPFLTKYASAATVATADAQVGGTCCETPLAGQTPLHDAPPRHSEHDRGPLGRLAARHGL